MVIKKHEDDEGKGWHLDRRITLSLVVAMSVMFGQELYSQGQMDKAFENLEKNMVRLERHLDEHEGKKAHDGQAVDTATLKQSIDDLQEDVDAIKRKLDIL